MDQLKEEFVKLCNQAKANKRELMRRFNISAPTGYKWLKRYEKYGADGLKERSRSRKSRHRQQIDIVTENSVIELRKKYPDWGARKLKRLLLNGGAEKAPSASAIHRAIKRHKLIPEILEGRGKGFTRFERSAPNDLWQMDYKGHFKMRNGIYCYPLTVCDDHSRYNLILSACINQETETVMEKLERAFKRYGLPRQILCDNGGPWGCQIAHSTHIETWLLRIGVEVIHGRPYHPQTQGKEERFHRTLKAELLSKTTVWDDTEHCQSLFDEWRKQYNNIRPHQALDYKTPSEIYSISDRSFPSKIAEPSSFYLDDDEKKIVKTKGDITFKNRSFTIGRAFIGQKIALRHIKEEQWDVYYCWKCLGKIDLSKTTKAKNYYESLIK